MWLSSEQVFCDSESNNALVSNAFSSVTTVSIGHMSFKRESVFLWPWQ